MATIRVRDWTKERIEEIRDAESHSSHDSVIKTLLKDRELAQYADTAAAGEGSLPRSGEAEPAEKAFDNLTVLAETVSPDNGLVFLWCPNCGNEVAHLGVENPLSMSVFEAECQRCLTRLDQHAIVAIEIGYPIEQQLVDETLQADLQRCVVDYWDRALERFAAGRLDTDLDDETFVWKLGDYYRDFDWTWPADVPVITLEVGKTYRDENTGHRLEVLAVDAENRTAPEDYRVRRFADGEDGETVVLDADTVLDLVLSRNTYLDAA